MRGFRKPRDDNERQSGARCPNALQQREVLFALAACEHDIGVQNFRVRSFQRSVYNPMFFVLKCSFDLAGGRDFQSEKNYFRHSGVSFWWSAFAVPDTRLRGDWRSGADRKSQCRTLYSTNSSRLR